MTANAMNTIEKIESSLLGSRRPAPCQLKTYQYNGGVSVPTLDRKVVHKIEVVVPNSKTQALFGDSVLPMFTQIRNLGIYNDKLRTARDLLLPKLMSGEINV